MIMTRNSQVKKNVKTIETKTQFTMIKQKIMLLTK